jgi:putative membrane protein
VIVSYFALILADFDGDHMGDGWWVVMVLGMALFWGLVILGGIWLTRELVAGRGRGREPDALELLDRRFAEGAISPEDYRERRRILTGSPPGDGG